VLIAPNSPLWTGVKLEEVETALVSEGGGCILLNPPAFEMIIKPTTSQAQGYAYSYLKTSKTFRDTTVQRVKTKTNSCA